MGTSLRPRALGVIVVACLGLAIAPAAVAASPDLINQVQSQINASGGTLPTDPTAQQAFVDQLVQSGSLPASQHDSALAAVQALASSGPTPDVGTIAALLGSGLSPSQITALAAVTPTSAYDTFLQGFSISGDATPTGTSLRPLTDAMRQLAATLPAGDAKTTLISLADQIDAVGSADVPGALLDQLRGALALVGTLTEAAQQALNKLLGSLVPVTHQSIPGATPAGVSPPQQPVLAPQVQSFNLVLKVSKIKLARNRKTAAVTLRSSVPAPSLPVGFATMLGRKSAAKPVLLNLATGENVTKKVKLTRAATKTLKKKGGTLKVVPAFAVPGLSSVPGVTLAQTAKSLKVRKPRAHRRRR
jgi:hypothetical protein